MICPSFSMADAGVTRILMLGDSLTAGYGLAENQALPAQLERRLVNEGYQVRIINAGVSGDTMAQGQARLEWSLADEPDAAIVALGANDALRGLPPEQMRRALDAILMRLQEEGIDTLLVGMEAPRNYGAIYARDFAAVYTDAVKKYGVDFYPFLLEGVALKPELNQADGIHPTAEGIEVIATKLLPQVRTLIQ